MLIQGKISSCTLIFTVRPLINFSIYSNGILERAHNIVDDQARQSPNEPILEIAVEPRTPESESHSSGAACKKICIFCQAERKKHQGRWEKMCTCEKKETISAFKTTALESGNVNLMDEINSLQALEKRIFYHPICKLKNFTNTRSIVQEKNEKTEWHIKRNVASAAFEKVVCFVNGFVVQNLQMYSVNFLKKMYVEFLSEILQGQEDLLPAATSRYFEERLLARFNKKIVLVQINGQQIIKPFGGYLLGRRYPFNEIRKITGNFNS